MKLNIHFWILFFLLFLFSCKQGERIVQKPAFSGRNGKIIEIHKIILNDTTTTFYVDATYRPKYWILIDSTGYLEANGRKYKILRGEGIQLSKKHWMPDSGKSSFRLIFPPLPRLVKRVDYIESDNDENGLNFWDIELRQGAKPQIPGLPKELRNLPTSSAESLATPAFKIGKTKLNIHLLNIRKGMEKEPVFMQCDDILTRRQHEYEKVPDSTQICHFEFEQYGTKLLSIVYKNKFRNIMVDPGEEIDLWLDLGAWSQLGTPSEENNPNPTGYVRNGKYMPLNNSLMKGLNYHLKYPRLSPETLLSISPQTYIDTIFGSYHKALDSLSKDSCLSGELKDYLKRYYQEFTLRVFLDYEQRCRSAYREVNKINWDVKNIDYHAPEMTMEMLKCLQELDINDPSMFYLSQLPQLLQRLFQHLPTPEKLEECLGTNKGLLFDLQKTQGIYEKIENLQPLTEEEQLNLASTSDKFYPEAFTQMQKNMEAQLATIQQKSGFTICDIPKVSDDKLFDAIIARYKGKVILIDYWATWCGPCRSAMKNVEPIKEELKDEDIVYVYFTGESSPQATWLKMTADIKGEHYRFSSKQWNAVCQKFNIQTIPSYVVVDKKGKATLREDFPNASLMKKVLMEESKK